MSAGGRVWAPPGPGLWGRDRQHFPQPATAHMVETLPAIEEGIAYTAERYGWLIETVGYGCVNAVPYASRVPIDPSQIPARCDAAQRVFETKQWREDVEGWRTVVKPAALAAHRSLIDVDPSTLATEELGEYLARCRDHHYAMWLQHHHYNGAHLVPTGDFLSAAARWTGLPASRLVQLLSGASPVSRGDCPELRALSKALADSPDARAILRRSDLAAGDVLAALADFGGEVGDALAEWLVVTGHRLIDGFDISYPCALERPALLVAALSRLSDTDSVSLSLESDVVAVRELVPAEHRGDFDERYEEARGAFHIRDERGIYSDATAAGIVRRAWLAAGDRLVAAGLLSRRELALDATCDELRSLLDGGGGAVAVGELERRAAFRAGGAPDAPESLGEATRPLPAGDALPPGALRMVAAVTGLPELPGGADIDDSARELQGAAASPGAYRGTARVVLGADDLDRIEDGDVMVTVTTGEAFNVAIAIVGALVTDVGGLMSHAGITCREYGIPAVVGARRATELIPDGAVVEVDGTTGVVRWS